MPDVPSFSDVRQEIARLVSVGVTATPVPVRVTVCGEPGALLAIETDADSPPAEVGEKVTLIVQLALAESALPQAFDCPNSVAFVPVTEMLVILSVALPELVSVTDCALLVVPVFWLPKETLVVASETAGADGGGILLGPM